MPFSVKTFTKISLWFAFEGFLIERPIPLKLFLIDTNSCLIVLSPYTFLVDLPIKPGWVLPGT